MTDRYHEEIGGQRPHTDPYTEVIDRECPTCGSPAGEKCTFEPNVKQPGGGIAAERRTRHHPCISRFNTAEGR